MNQKEKLATAITNFERAENERRAAQNKADQAERTENQMRAELIRVMRAVGVTEVRKGVRDYRIRCEGAGLNSGTVVYSEYNGEVLE